jgi:hypothetical protein
MYQTEKNKLAMLKVGIKTRNGISVNIKSII